MKKTILSLAFVSMGLTNNAQTPWSTALNSGTSLKFGTSSSSNLVFYTNSHEGMTLTTDGKLKINALAGTDDRIVYVDANGNFKAAPDGGGGTSLPGIPCIPSARPWYIGGNVNPSDSHIGTCSPTDFILKANNNSAVFIKPSGYVGIGLNNGSPQAALDIFDASNVLNTNHIKIYGDQTGRIESDIDMNLAANNDLVLSAVNDLRGAAAKNINFDASESMDLLFNTTGTLGSTTNFNIHAGAYSPGSSEALTIKPNSYVGIGTTNPNSKLTVSTSGAQNGLNVITSSSGYAFAVHNTTGGIHAVWNDGRVAIGSTSCPDLAKLNVNVNGAGTAINVFDISSSSPNQVRFKVNNDGGTTVGSQTGALNTAMLNVNVNGGTAFHIFDQATNKVNFTVLSSGYTFCRDLTVSAGVFADYVFDKSYKLMPISELENYIATNKHLPGFKSGDYYVENGITTSDMFVKQQEKIEELTLYIIALEKRMKSLENK